MKFYLLITRYYLNVLSFIAPKYGAKKAIAVFSKVRKKTIKAKEEPFFENATKFTQGGERILIEIAPGARSLDISVSDEGPGILPADRPRLQERFVKGPAHSGRSQGAGLGLSVVAAIAHGHGGTLGVGESKFGGAKMTLRIPR